MVDPIVSSALAKAEQTLSPAAKTFAEGVVGGPAQEVGALFADRIRARRWRTQIRLFERAAKYARERGIEPSKIPLKTLFPLLDAATLEDEHDDEMVDRWASLLASCAGDAATVPPSFVDVLRQLSPVDARVLDGIYGVMCQMSVDDWEAYGVRPELLVDFAAREEVTLVMDNLIRLNLVRPPLSVIDHIPVSRAGYEIGVNLTWFGYCFVSACRAPGQALIPPTETPQELKRDAREYSRWLAEHRGARRAT